MILPTSLVIKSTDTAEIAEIKKAVNALLQLHYEVHQVEPEMPFDPRQTFKNEQGGGC